MNGTKNNRLRNIILITAAVAVVSLGIATALFFAADVGGEWGPRPGLDVNESRSFPIDQLDKIEVRTSSVDVLVVQSKTNSVDIHLHGTVYTGRSESIPTLAAESTGRVLKIETERKDGRTFFLGFYSDNLVLEIAVPAGYEKALNVHTGSGDVQISDQILSELSVETGSGEIQIELVEADNVTLDSSSGDQRLDHVAAAQSSITSGSGEIRAQELEGGARVKSSSGDITLRYRDFDADLEVHSGSGEVKLYLTHEAQFRLEAKASSGDIACTFPITLAGADSEMRRNRVMGVVGQGTHRVSVQTASGDIDIQP